MNSIFSSVLNTQTTAEQIDAGAFFLCLLCSLVLGGVIALIYTIKNKYSKSFLVTLALLPSIVQIVIMLVNGSIGTGIAVMGAFSLIRFRSVPGSAKEICSIFLAMAVGLATGMGYLAFAAIFVVIIGVVELIYNFTRFGETKKEAKELRITIPESLDYTGVFDEIFEKYAKEYELLEIKTTNMGSLFKLRYNIVFKEPNTEKQLIDDLRCRNGNLEISCCKAAVNREEL